MFYTIAMAFWRDICRDVWRKFMLTGIFIPKCLQNLNMRIIFAIAEFLLADHRILGHSPCLRSLRKQ
jgi:hypothetical protein